jgi:hypothetical protein
LPGASTGCRGRPRGLAVPVTGTSCDNRHRDFQFCDRVGTIGHYWTVSTRIPGLTGRLGMAFWPMTTDGDPWFGQSRGKVTPPRTSPRTAVFGAPPKVEVGTLGSRPVCERNRILQDWAGAAHAVASSSYRRDSAARGGRATDHARPPPQDVAPHRLATPQEIADRLLRVIGDVDGGQLPGTEQPNQLPGAPLVGLDALVRAPRRQCRRDHLTGHAEPGDSAIAIRDRPGRRRIATTVSVAPRAHTEVVGWSLSRGPQIGTSCHQPSPIGTGTYSVVQPHQSGM